MPLKLGNFIKDHWPAAIAIIGMAAAWGSMTSQIATVAKSNETIVQKLDRVAEDVAGVKASTTHTSSDIADLRERVRSIEVFRH